MSLTSEMSRTTAEIAAARRERVAAIAKIRSDLKRETHRNETSRADAMAAHHAATKSSLRDIFGTAAFTRGAAEEMIERFRKEREEAAGELWPKLNAYAANVRETVSEEMAQFAAARATMANRERRMRRTHLKELRRHVSALLASADKLIDGLNHDRTRAGHVWEQHVRNGSRQLPPAKRATPKRAAPKRAAAAATEASVVARHESRQSEGHQTGSESMPTPVSEE